MVQENVLQDLLSYLKSLGARIDQLEASVIASFTVRKKDFNSKEAAIYTGLSMSSLDKKCSNRKISYTKVGKMRRFSKESLDKFLAGTPIKSDAEIDDEAELLLMRKSRGVNAKNR